MMNLIKKILHKTTNYLKICNQKNTLIQSFTLAITLTLFGSLSSCSYYQQSLEWISTKYKKDNTPKTDSSNKNKDTVNDSNDNKLQEKSVKNENVTSYTCQEKDNIVEFFVQMKPSKEIANIERKYWTVLASDLIANRVYHVRLCSSLEKDVMKTRLSLMDIVDYVEENNLKN
jgi:hypothetical protein